MNLTVNARDAMPDGGVLRISTEPVIRAGGRHISLTVADTGIGMNAETQRRIFEPFFTTKGPGAGTGLGLSTVYGIVEQSGGHIAIESEAGRGTAFTIYLPAVDPAAPAEQENGTGQVGDAGRGTERILLVEDDAAVRNLVAEALTVQGYQVLAAEGPDQALEFAQREDELDLLFTDLLMPQMNGRELARRLAEQRPHLRVLYSSGYAGERDGTGEDPRAFLQKPYSLSILAAKVREVLDADRQAV